MQAYHRSKLANLLFAYELARRPEGEGLLVNAAKPGFTRTGLGHGHGWSPLLPILKLASALAAQSPEQGARASVFLASAPEAAGATGRYFFRETAIESSAASHDREAARRLWALSEELTGSSEK